MFAIDLRSRVPIYEQLVQNIVHLIAEGVLQPDDQLQSVRSLARELGINPNTVQKAYQELESKGLIYQAAGRGSFVAEAGTLTDAIWLEKIELVKERLILAKGAGVPKQRITTLVDTVYGEGEA